MTVVDLFAGPGGWDVAARDLGLDPLGVELDDAAIRTRTEAGLRTLSVDVARLDPESLDIDGLLASPPCQAFSSAGKRKGRNDLPLVRRAAIQLFHGRDERHRYLAECEDPRSLLVVEPLRYALATMPGWMAWEQVPPVLPFWELCASLLRRSGYSVWTGLLHAETFGVPQTRKRAFLIASLGDRVGPPPATHSRYHVRSPERLDDGVLPWVSMASALGWDADGVVNTRGKGASGGNEFSSDRPSWALTSKARSWVVRSGQSVNGVGRAERDVDHPALTVGSRADQWAFFRSSRMSNAAVRPTDHPAPTLAFGHDSASKGWTNEPTEMVQEDGRKITTAEAAILQSFPADYPWQGTRTKQFEQIGNAVPPGMARPAIAAAMASSVGATAGELAA